MKQFDFYEFAGILLPGAIALVALVLLFPQWGTPTLIKDLGLGGLGVFLVLAYALGHLVQAVGNFVEWVWWKCWGGMPSDWVCKKPECLLAPQQSALLVERVRAQQGLSQFDIASAARHDWYAVTRQVYAAVAGAGRANRIDVFNGNYGLNRGLAAGFLVALVLMIVKGPADWRLVVAVVIGLALSIYRMHRFGRHYARELFVQFLQLPPREAHKENM